MSLLGAAAALAVGLVLLAAGTGHLRDTAGTRRALAAHGVLPDAWRPAVAGLLGPLEVLLGLGLIAGAAGLLGPAPTRTVALAAVLLLAGLTAYLTVVQRGRDGRELPCGCGLGTAPVGHWAILRAAVLGVLALVPAAAPVQSWVAQPGAPVWAQVTVAIAGGLALAVATATLPAARALPEDLTTLRGAAR